MDTSKTEETSRYHPYHREKTHRSDRRYDDDDYRRPYKKTNKHHYQYHDNRNYNDFSYRRSHRHDYRHPPSKPKSHSRFSTPPPPLMSIPAPPPLPPPPPPPPSPSPLLAVVPHERESWIRSVKKTKTNESTEQKTQYLETMLRMPQPKAALNVSRFDRMRFADDRLSTTIVTVTSSANLDQLDDSSFHLIGDISSNEDIRTLEKILFDKDLDQAPQQSNISSETSDQEALPAPSSSVVENQSADEQPVASLPCSGFLIDNCEEQPPPVSQPPSLPLPSADDASQSVDETVTEQRAMLVSELDAADAERKQALRRQKRLHQKLQKKKRKKKTEDVLQPKSEKQLPSSSPEVDTHESFSDWVIEHDANNTDQISQLTNEVRRTSIGTTDEEKTAKVNMILLKIKKQQQELNRLRKYVMSMFGEQEKSKPAKITRSDSSIAHDVLLAFLNQPAQSGCWLCSGKMYAEAGTQCDHGDEQ